MSKEVIFLRASVISNLSHTFQMKQMPSGTQNYFHSPDNSFETVLGQHTLSLNTCSVTNTTNVKHIPHG